MGMGIIKKNENIYKIFHGSNMIMTTDGALQEGDVVQNMLICDYLCILVQSFDIITKMTADVYT